MRRAGDRLRALAVRMLDRWTMERIVDPLLADLEMEYADAIQHGRVWRGRWILISGHFAFLKTVALCQAGEAMRVSRAWTIEEREALSRALKFSALAGAIATLVLAAPPIMNARLGVPNPRMFIYLVAQAIVLAVPIGITFGVFLGLRGRTLSTRSTRTVLACAIFCSCACLATLAWIVPSANQNPRVLAYNYHMRWALSCATLVLALFALAMARRMAGRWTVALAAVCACFFYYVLMWIGRAGALQDALPDFVGAWLPNGVFALAWLALSVVVARGQNAQAGRSA